MLLASGSRLGVYEVLAPLGAGGMGEVYRARDAKLNREVAIKIMPAAFAADPARLARFQREAQVLASLNHPGIAAIYGFEAGGSPAQHPCASGGRWANEALDRLRGASGSDRSPLRMVAGWPVHLCRGSRDRRRYCANHWTAIERTRRFRWATTAVLEDSVRPS